LADAPPDISASVAARREKSFARYAIPTIEGVLHVMTILIFVFEIIERILPEPALLYRVQSHNVPYLMLEIVEIENTSNAPLFPLTAAWKIDPPNPAVSLQTEATAPSSQITATPQSRTITLKRALSAYEQTRIYLFAQKPFTAQGPDFTVYVSNSLGDVTTSKRVEAIIQETWDARRWEFQKKLLLLSAGLVVFVLFIRESSRRLSRKFA
jgi:hypothetical protein